ncbi:phage baseplate assembly protein [Commensalibacter papalotli (ex Botero et al. 2024)]|uniref:phage baseplate assembly protein domain-containing protein n=1 Tax=Commensalibacter papalotli (ex Botero et al. 2024) TaxID=2972766 RepID=UPI0022FF8752|nr:phage baseplate assembly protein [Commensalibacter papalotli (ex Botero et al. 2024)]CAI3945653.1 Mu-like prophage protein gp45 (gp45) (PDB:3VTN) [Commensalibacter papalotli (ex Botero et al. 2024)]
MADDSRTAATRIHMSMGIGRITKGVQQGQNTPSLQACFAGNEQRDNIYFMQHYGFASMPVVGADVTVSFQSGDRNKGVVVASNDQRYRIKTLKDGEVAIYHKSGSSVILKEDGSIEMNASNKKMIINSDVQIKGDMTVTKNVNAQNMKAYDDVKAGSISLKSHQHPKGYNNSSTGEPTS